VITRTPLHGLLALVVNVVVAVLVNLALPAGRPVRAWLALSGER
jgi:hypothetical protein